MNSIERKEYQLQVELNNLKVKIAQAEKWIEMAKDHVYEIQELIYNIEDMRLGA